ncbi:MAG: cell division protein FtsA [Prevotella sp.]|nr:cell division protein FtsA [Prevotella sp.]
MAAKDFIVAIELGSSKITGIAGKKSMDGSIQVLAVVREDATSCIRKGVVYNIDKTSACLTNIIKKLKTSLKSEISQVYVGVGGQSIRSMRNVIVKTLPDDTIIAQDMINELMDNNRSMSYPDLEILDAATQEYKVGTQYQIDPVGIQSNKIEGNFLNILCRKSFYRNLNKCFENAKIAIAEMYLAPIALAQSVLTEAEKRSGCMLVDLGADTTTVSVYYKNILRHLVVIPLGGNNITKDIASLQMEDSEAEEMKIKYASAYTDSTEIEPDKTIAIDAERNIDMQTFVDLVEARVNEIIQNAWLQVPQEYNDKLLGGIILTGGGSNMKNIKKAFTNITNIQKIRIANTVTQNVTSTDKDINARNGMMNTIIGLLARGDMNCAGSAINPNADLFSGAGAPTSGNTGDIHNKPRKPGEMGTGVVMTEAEKQRAEEERRRKAEAEAEALRIREEEERRRAEEQKPGGFFKRTAASLKNFASKLVAEEPEEEDKR